MADPTKQRYIVRLNEYIAQIFRVGNNYNQVVKTINTCTCCPDRSTRWWPARAS